MYVKNCEENVSSDSSKQVTDKGRCIEFPGLVMYRVNLTTALHPVVEKHCLVMPLLLGYILTVGFMSFAVCYKYGPLENERSINLLTWTLQLLGLGFMYSGIQIPHVAFALIVIALCTKNLEYPIYWLYSTYR